MQPDVVSSSADIAARVARYPLLAAMLNRRSRRFAPGMRLDGDALAYTSTARIQPLTHDEEAALAFAANGVTGYTLAELPYTSPDPEAAGGNVIVHFVGRTVASGDALHNVVLFVINDDGAWLLKRPQDYPRAAIGQLIEAAHAHRLTELYDTSRIRIADRRVDVPRQQPFVPAFNRWSANLPGTTYFLPIHELTALYINVLLAAFSEPATCSIVDEFHRYQSAGLKPFLRSRGGHLHDDPQSGRVATIGFTETWLCEFAAWEEGAMLQNLALMCEALGLGGFPHFAAYPSIWMQTLGFTMIAPPFSRTIGAGPLTTRLLKLLHRDVPVPTAIGLERDGVALLKPFCPPYYPTMKDAVLAFVDYKYAENSGTMRDGGAATAWRDGDFVQRSIPRYDDRAIDATIAYCEYIYNRYGRFPATGGPFRTVLAFQAHHLDPAFYDRFYRPDALRRANGSAAANA